MNRGSLVVRSIVAILLLVGFYVLSLGIAGGLLWLAYAQVFIAHHVFLKLVLLCVVAAGLILWSIVPRPDRFEPPGPRITEQDHPRLFALVKDVGARTGQALPRDVYLVADVNAFVTQRGGIIGLFSHRVMGIGLPLMSLLSVSELSAVLAHEFGHFYGGDTKLGPWIYKTRGAIVRTVVSLSHGAGGWGQLVGAPFRAYLQFFLRTTQSISRAQELEADALAARVIGPLPLVRGLKAVHGGAAAFQAYVEHEFGPVLNAGFRPPFAEGFRAFVDGKHVKAQVEKLVSRELAEGEEDPFDTHPPLAQRIAALEALPAGDHPSDDGPALGLLNEHESAEAELIRSDRKRLEPLAWSKVAAKVLLPGWRKDAKRVVEQLGAPTIADLVMTGPKLGKLAAKMLKRDLSQNPDAAAHVGANICGAAISATLADAGWSVNNRVGRPISLRLGELKLLPFKDFTALARGELEPEKLLERLSEVGVADLAIKG